MTNERNALFDKLYELRRQKSVLARKRDRLRGDTIVSTGAATLMGAVGRALVAARSLVKNELEEVVAEITRLEVQIADIEGRIKSRERDHSGLNNSLRQISQRRQQLGC